VASTPKKPWVAFLLSIFLTGAGLAYLGKWGWAVLNLLAALGIGYAAIMVYPEFAVPVGFGVLAGSAIMAKNLAEKMNNDFATPQPTGMQPPTPVISVSTENNFSKPAEPISVKLATVVCAKCGSTTEIANFCAECGAPLPQGSSV
jgi:hypothetical protein